ncbi:gamma-glutamylcyclotransferase family protein [Mycolicibacterium fortuitum]|uniref:gamma-glutamylcyclotransferase family protein n=1 Tax=Mycolicibacterium fortuitum TaxID=1766 RepID=UPI001AEFD2A6|nr:gamma-glutamylcyclotransferase family protein [Mycolicibacterium fortuitum]MBP3083103.1 gamma-glutamylcyclotransferase [Mycolicibacterium fortuitum]
MNTLGTELSTQLFRPVTWTTQSASSWPAAGYPGRRPKGSWLMEPDGTLRGLDPADSGWQDRDTGKNIDLSNRHLVLAYGSNPDPRKLLARQGFFGGDRVIALRAVIFGWGAAWCDARRRTEDKSVVATLVTAPGRAEVHPVFALTPHQLAEMDRWEGHPTVYQRRAHVGEVLLEPGERAGDVQVYLGVEKRRPALIVTGQPVLCADMPQSEVDRLVER